MSIAAQKQQLQELMRLHYGFTDFRPGQETAIDAILAGQDALIIMPTGGGKSLCYQLPALVIDGLTLVVSPLIALMKDQVDSLQKIGLPATFINSSLSDAETNQRLESLRQGAYRLVYVAPERFYSANFLNSLATLKIGLFAVDEAHCISQWGHDFRPSYMRLGQVTNNLGRPPIIALTATATPEVQEDIIKQLQLKAPARIITGFARPNLQFAAQIVSDSQKIDHIIRTVQSQPNSSGIIYVGTRAKADEILQILLDYGLNAVGYHAGLEAEQRQWVQNNFMSDQAKIIVATNAFGMGVDKKNIRFVIHHDLPGTVEAYYQEAGRAGRDGDPSLCLLLYGSRDRYLREFFIQGDNPDPKIILQIYQYFTDLAEEKIQITYSELKKTLGLDAPEMAIGTAVKILEQGGYLRKLTDTAGQASLKLTASFADALSSLSGRAKKQLAIFNELSQRFGDELLAGWQVNLDEIANLIGHKKATIINLFKKLAEQNLADYRPAFQGTELKILQFVSPDDLQLNFAALRAKAQRAYEKLDKMESYVYHSGCRQQYLLQYFGDHQSSPCGLCDYCCRPTNSGATKTYLDPSAHTKNPINPAGKLGTKLTQLETWELHNQGLDPAQIAERRGLTVEDVGQHLVFLAGKKLPLNLDKIIPANRQRLLKKIIKKHGRDFKKLQTELPDCQAWEIQLMTLN